MPPGARPINPVGDLAAIYRARIPQPTPRQLFGPQAVARIQPNMRRGPGVLGTIANVGKQVISSLDPRFILSQGGKSVEHVAGDIYELGRSIITGEDTLSESPSARAYQQAGEGFSGVVAAALPYVNVATAVVPTTKLLTPAGRTAMAADAAERVGQRLIAQHVPERPLGIHVSPIEGLQTINPRTAMQRQTTAADSLTGSSYMWDIRSPRITEQVFENPQMSEMTGLGNPPPRIYVTEPTGRVFQDANIPMSAGLRVEGGQRVVAELPFNQQMLNEYMAKRGITPRSLAADRYEQAYRGLAPTVRTQIENRPAQMAEEGLRTAIRMANKGNRYYETLVGLDEVSTLEKLLSNPAARELFDSLVTKYKT